MEPVVLFGIQFTLALIAYALIGFWYAAPRLSALPREVALAPLLWVHRSDRYATRSKNIEPRVVAR